MKNYTKEEIIEAIKDSGGIVLNVANELGCSWYTAERYINMYEETKQAFKDEDSTLKDQAKRNVKRAIENGDIDLTKWFLARRDKDYNDKQEIQHSGDINIVYLDKQDEDL